MNNGNNVKQMSGVEVKTLRLKMHMTQEDLAHALGVTVSTVNRWENGHTRPSRLAAAGLERLVENFGAQPQPAFVEPQARAVSGSR